MEVISIAGTSIKNQIHVNHSDTVDAKETKITLYPKKLVNINANAQEFAAVST